MGRGENLTGGDLAFYGVTWELLRNHAFIYVCYIIFFCLKSTIHQSKFTRQTAADYSNKRVCSSKKNISDFYKSLYQVVSIKFCGPQKEIYHDQIKDKAMLWTVFSIILASKSCFAFTWEVRRKKTGK